MRGFTPSQQRRHDAAREVLAKSREMDVRDASPTELSKMIGRLEVELEQALRLIDELTGAE